MPTYDYKHDNEQSKCSAGVVFEKFESIKAEPMTQCPSCKEPVKRLVGGGASYLLKGSGFYETDYKK